MNVMTFVYVLTIDVFIDYVKSGSSSSAVGGVFSVVFEAAVSVPTIPMIGLNPGIDPTADFNGCIKLLTWFVT